ncbi:MAG: glucans biosynthesis glucosyltransferase MdoH [Alphaproteobacteria bacterium]|nr:glucans biosynthesis glucosyltransferase MdoH [Alphaproteobacteria bacterium]
MDNLGAKAGTPSNEPHNAPEFIPAPSVPPETYAEMPSQSLREWNSIETPKYAPGELSQALFRRGILFAGTLLLTFFAGYGMYRVMGVNGLTNVQILILLLFVPNFAWISFWFVSAVMGFVVALRPRPTLRVPRLAPGSSMILSKRTALVMPTYNEPPHRIYANIQAMYEALREMGALRSFDIFILSDTTEAAIWLEEEEGFRDLRARTGGDANLFYRRRPKNIARKSGNVEDFCRRWGMNYEHMIVLDADSLMTGEALVRLAAVMEVHPEAGIIQTAPQIINGGTLFARLQQFAGQAYGPVVASGLAYWHMGDGNYWGHNAIIRTRAFLENAGLPALPGRAPFGGHILSHDFVEAALLRRGGWKVYMAAEIEGSYEESPPALIDYAARDRRWCQGNMQHMAVLRTRGLHWLSRLHLGLGIFGYLASPFWLSFLLAGMVLSLQARYVRPEYFTDEFQIFPTWPVINPQLAAWLYAGTMAVLLGPKILGVALVMRDRGRAAEFGGRGKLLAGLLLETFLSSMTAPVMMLIQTSAVMGTLAGRDVGWRTQRRGDDRIPFREVALRHRGHTILGVLLGVSAHAVAPMLLAWMSPVVLGLVLSIPLSALGSSRRCGGALAGAGLLLTPQESNPHPIIVRSRMIQKELGRKGMPVTDPVMRIATEPELRQLHQAMLLAPRPGIRGDVDVDYVVAMARLDQAESIEDAVRFLSPKEKLALLGSAEGVARLAGIAQPPADAVMAG